MKPTTDNAFDVTVEYYLPHAGVFAIGLFDKEFDNYVINTLRIVNSDPRIPDTPLKIAITGFNNVPNSYARGIEAQYEQKFTSLPGLLGGLGLNGNVTYVDSRIEIRPGEFTQLPGTSQLTWNLAGFYEAHGLQIRISAQNTSAVIFNIGDRAGLDTFQDDKTQVDYTMSYVVNRRATVYFNARNLTDGALRFYEGFQNRPTQREFYGQSYEAGLRFHF